MYDQGPKFVKLIFFLFTLLLTNFIDSSFDQMEQISSQVFWIVFGQIKHIFVNNIRIEKFLAVKYEYLRKLGDFLAKFGIVGYC